MKRFQIVLSTLDYGQTKIRNVKKNTFAEASSEATQDRQGGDFPQVEVNPQEGMG
jgi:hypothetical protein